MQKKRFIDNILVKRFIFTIIILFIFRFGVHIPIPGIDAKALASFANQQSSGLLKIFNVFSGGALSRFSIFSLALMPYISASIIMQLLTVVMPSLEQLQREGGVGRQKINRITRFLTIFLAFIQAYLLAAGLELARGASGSLIVLNSGISFRILSAVLMTAGSCFVLWLGEQITEKGIGNGISILIFAGIVAYLPSSLFVFIDMIKQNQSIILGLFFLLIFILAAIFVVVFFEQSYRKIPIHYAKRIAAKSLILPQANTHLPLKVNMSGIMAAIFASTILSVPNTIFSLGSSRQNITSTELFPGHWLYNIIFVILGLFFSFFYSSIIFRADDIAENLKKQNAYIPAIRPGIETSIALDTVVSRLTLAGAIYMSIIVIIPSLVMSLYTSQMSLSGTSLLIVVGVALEAIRQVTAQLATQRYDSLIFSSDSSIGGSFK